MTVCRSLDHCNLHFFFFYSIYDGGTEVHTSNWNREAKIQNGFLYGRDVESVRGDITEREFTN